ncbi:Protein of unknown function [Gryllus bimaculatus]|nr:Protein of unknown function [Gryllus bimaculatus]
MCVLQHRAFQNVTTSFWVKRKCVIALQQHETMQGLLLFV